MAMFRKGAVCVIVIVAVSAVIAARSEAEVVRRPAAAKGTVIVPDRFLRRWDPVTIFFAADVGPDSGPEDHPEKHVRMNPAHPGAFRWLNRRTLQFRPAEAWPPLTRFVWQVGTTSVKVSTLMPPPASTVPAAGASGLEPVDTITLMFPEPIDPKLLARVVTIELRALPGVGGRPASLLDQDDFSIKTLERRSRADLAGYVLELSQPIPPGMAARVRLRLSLDDDADESMAQFEFSTAEPFRMIAAGCRVREGYRVRERTYPISHEGSKYAASEALGCDSNDRGVFVQFSTPPRAISPVEGRNLVRFTPPVDDLTFEVAGKKLEIKGKFVPETVYRITLTGLPISDTHGRRLEARGESELHVHFPRLAPFLHITHGHAILERFGPQMLPIQGRGDTRLDLRIHPIDPLDRSFWPFPDNGVHVDEAKRPPSPGEEPAPFTAAERNVNAWEIAKLIPTFGSPLVSALIDLPLRADGPAANFGLDLAPHLEKIAGRNAPGTYLVGVRRINESSFRQWMRVQVTDLALTAVEEPHAVRFAVTSLSTGKPVKGATIRIEGAVTGDGKTTWQLLGEGVTDSKGQFTWPAPGRTARMHKIVRRIFVKHQEDVLVLDPAKPPEKYKDNQWFDDDTRWLQWTQDNLDQRGPQLHTLCHIFTERPVYRPEEAVHIKGFVRVRAHGSLAPARFAAFLIVQGPGEGQVWRYPVTISPSGSFYHRFTEPNLPSGEFYARLEDDKENACGTVSFKMEAYRIPTFEVRLHSADQVPSDGTFDVQLTATYYAGGKVSGRPVQWRVTQFPYLWSHKTQEGFVYSSDARYSGAVRFESTARLDRQDTTDDSGGAKLTLDPAIEPNALPRTYVIEATVTGVDDQTVTATRRVHALPPFVLGAKVPRFIERAKEIEAEIVALGLDGEPLAGLPITARLLRRQWHSVLRASDFSTGVAKYVTDVVDEKIEERSVQSAQQPVKIAFPIQEAGVYLVEIEAHDRLQRAQVVRVDLYAGGDQPVSWTRPTTAIFEVATDKPEYDPGQTASLLLKSPFQSGLALAVVEGPRQNQYEWVPIQGGKGVFKLPIAKEYAPRVPVHFVLMRARILGTRIVPGGRLDLGKPATMAATSWVKVTPVDHLVKVDLEYPKRARPGERIDVTIRLRNPAGRPLAGEVTLWLVDQAVLALGKERPLDPIPDFLRPADAYVEVRDTRNLVLGELPFAELPGGDTGEEGSLFDRVTVRKLFKAVPYYNPTIEVGSDGVVTVPVELSEDLTNFKIRAKAISGPDRFGYATGEISVRLPVIVQPALPRFVRPGDRFFAAAISRIVEGEGGEGKAEIEVEGATAEGDTRRVLTWKDDRPERLELPLTVLTPPFDDKGRLTREHLVFRVAVERASDGVGDAFEVKLPIRDDRQPIVSRLLQNVKPGTAIELPAVSEPVRPGTLKRTLLISDQPALVRMVAGLSFLREFPHGCTEQRVSRVRSYVALRKLRDVLHLTESDDELRDAVNDVMEWLPLTLDSRNLVSFWPGQSGHVSLTAWVVQFLIEAKEAGFSVSEEFLEKLLRSLEQALRSDYSHFIDGAAYFERAWALSALTAAGRFNAAYASELARRAQYLDLEGVSEVVLSMARAGDTSSSTIEGLVERLWKGLIIRLHQGKEVYGGLQAGSLHPNGLVLPSETRTLAEVMRALREVDSGHPRVQVLINALVTLGRDDGWGDTNANAAALIALASVFEGHFQNAARRKIEVRSGEKKRGLEIGPEQPLAADVSIDPGAMQVAVDGAGDAPVVVRGETRYVPASPGSEVAPAANGFVVTRAMLKASRDEEAPPERFGLDEPGATVSLQVGDVVEEHVQVVNPRMRHYVAVVVPLAAGMEPLNPNLATAPPEAKTKGMLTRAASYVAFFDDRVAFYYDELPAGTYDFYFRTRAAIPGRFHQPPALAEMMYDLAVRGHSAGAVVEVGH